MRRTLSIVVLALLSGCGGGYILTAPDVAALPGETAPVVVRLQHREFWRYAPALEDAAITLRRADGVVRCARTDKAGYAVMALTMPATPGRYEAALYHQDLWGDTVSGKVRFYVLDPKMPIMVVDADSLPDGDDARPAAQAIQKIVSAAQVIYVTQKSSGLAAVRERLVADGYPESAVVPWGRARPWYRNLPWRDPPSDVLTSLRERLGGLKWGVSAEDDEAEAFGRAGLAVLAVGDFKVRGLPPDVRVHRFDGWDELRLPPAEPGD